MCQRSATFMVVLGLGGIFSGCDEDLQIIDTLSSHPQKTPGIARAAGEMLPFIIGKLLHRVDPGRDPNSFFSPSGLWSPSPGPKSTLVYPQPGATGIGVKGRYDNRSRSQFLGGARC